MSTLHIVLLSVAGAIALIALIFMIMFLVEITVSKKEKKEEEFEVKSIFSSEEYVKSTKVDEREATISSMLAKLDEQALVEKPVEVKEEIVETKEVNILEAFEQTEEIKEEVETSVEEVKEEAESEEVKETTEETTEEIQSVENTEEVAQEELVEENIEASAEETTEEATEENAETIEENVEEETVKQTEEVNAEVDGVKVEEIVGETISVESLPDYKARLDKIIENRDKINKDLIKVEKSILNYERTKRRKIRNQKMLDRRASELTNLNLVMYSVTDIKNVDEDKKIKQEELTSHIAELKASIQDAEEFLDSNKEKNDHDVKMAKFLSQEKARYNEEIIELQKLIAKTESSAS